MYQLWRNCVLDVDLARSGVENHSLVNLNLVKKKIDLQIFSQIGNRMTKLQ